MFKNYNFNNSFSFFVFNSAYVQGSIHCYDIKGEKQECQSGVCLYMQLSEDSLTFFPAEVIRRCATDEEVQRVKRELAKRKLGLPACIGMKNFIPPKCFCKEDGCNAKCTQQKCTSTETLGLQFCDAKCKSDAFPGDKVPSMIDRALNGSETGAPIQTKFYILLVLVACSLTKLFFE